MKAAVIQSSWMEGYGHRLDTKPYLGGALETKILLEQLPLRKDPLHTLTAGFEGGIYNGPQFVRNYVDSPEHGVPFMTGSTMQLADLSTLPFLSKRDAQSPKLAYLELQRGMSLISCSGSIGKMAYARREMEGVWSSQDILKVVADPAKIPSGYLYAYLCSGFGIPLVASGTYGAIIQHLEPAHIWDLPVPRLGDALEHEIHALVEDAAELRTNASAEISAVKSALLSACGIPPKFGTRLAGEVCSQTTSSKAMSAQRFDPWYFNAKAVALEGWVRSHPWGYRELADVSDVFGTSPFKRFYVEDGEHGIGFFGSADIFKLDRQPESYISKTNTKKIEDYILPVGAVLIASSGSLGGVIGRVQFVDSALTGQAASNHVARIVSTDEDFPAGFLFAYLSTNEIGYPLILRTATGDAIPEIWSVFLRRIPVLRAPEDLKRNTDKKIREAFEQRVVASQKEAEARALIVKNLQANN